MVVANGTLLVSPAKRLPHLWAVRRIGRNRKFKILSHDANDRECLIVQSNRFTDHIAIAVEAAAPKFITQNNFVITTGRILFLQKSATEYWLRSQDGKEAVRRAHRTQRFRMAGTG